MNLRCVLWLCLAALPGAVVSQAASPPAGVGGAPGAAGTGIRAPYPAIQVPPVTGPAVALPQLPPAAASPAPLALPRAAVITQCDPTGCWDSSGRRLNRVGPGLVAPGGPCTVQGPSALCP